MKKIIKKIQALLLATVGLGVHGGALTEFGVTNGADTENNSAPPIDTKANDDAENENEENDHDDEYGDDCDEEDDDDEDTVNNYDDNDYHEDDYEFGNCLVSVECGCYEDE